METDTGADTKFEFNLYIHVRHYDFLGLPIEVLGVSWFCLVCGAW